MTDMIRCPACRGAKKVAKLGGIIGECNSCTGKGQILASDKPVKVEPDVIPAIDNIVKAVADSVPASSVPLCAPSATVLEQDVKIDGKKALYKRKKA